MTYPFKNIALNRNRQIINYQHPSQDAGVGALAATARGNPQQKTLAQIGDDPNTGRYAVLNANVGNLAGTQTGTAYDGQAIVFNPAFAPGTVPTVIFIPGGMSYNSTAGSSVNQQQRFTAASLTNAGFTASLKLVTGGTSMGQSNAFTAVTSGQEYNATLASAPSVDNTYTVNFSVTMNASSDGTVYITKTNSSGTVLWSKSYFPYQNGSKSVSVTWSGATSTDVIDISLVMLDGTGIITASTVTYTTGTPPTSYSAVPSTSPIQWLAYPQT